MPYDPESDDGEAHTDYYSIDNSVRRSSHSPWGPDVDLSGQNDAEVGEPMDVDLVPTPSTRQAQVAVVLNSTPKKSEYVALPDDMEDDQDGQDDPEVLVTSDILPMKKAKSEPKPSLKKDTSEPTTSTPMAGPNPVPFPLPTVTPQPKKRGRPFGWKLGSGPYSTMSKSGPGSTGRPRGRPPVKTPKPPQPPGEPKRRGRPPRKQPPTPWETYINSNPKFLVFLCEWEGCPAQLHNLETLRRHLLVVHGKAGTCKWGDCPTKHPSPLTFSTSADFEAHLDKTHILACAWHLGDGPQNHSDNPPPPDPPDKLPSYLFDRNGKQVTPWVGDLEVEDDEARKKRKLRLGRLLMQRDNNAPPEPSYTPQEWAEIADALNAKRKKQRMFREYHAAVCGTDGHGPKYGPEWKGLLVKEAQEQ
ncbi:hypothetical protein QBC47DRAFT_369972 [Echria macrotheca]|uniref:C2H2-type domain-containing protein n=1 Tax=Echria macrotheca TaxID=438768 RepID=A0AAJ0BNR8_9PEZI|nr:hypothetical protein QBC47DRAFT_369972 [Echria macrotheca]